MGRSSKSTRSGGAYGEGKRATPQPFGRCVRHERWGCGGPGRMGPPIVSVIAFHEKTGRSQEDWFWYLLVTLFLPRRVATVATLPSALFNERFSLGASWVFSFQPVLPPDYRPRFHLEDESWARRLTQSPELGFRIWLFLRRAFWFYAAAGIALNLLLRNGS